MVLPLISGTWLLMIFINEFCALGLICSIKSFQSSMAFSCENSYFFCASIVSSFKSFSKFPNEDFWANIFLGFVPCCTLVLLEIVVVLFCNVGWIIFDVCSLDLILFRLVSNLWTSLSFSDIICWGTETFLLSLRILYCSRSEISFFFRLAKPLKCFRFVYLRNKVLKGIFQHVNVYFLLVCIVYHIDLKYSKH